VGVSSHLLTSSSSRCTEKLEALPGGEIRVLKIIKFQKDWSKQKIKTFILIAFGTRLKSPVVH
jgi:hypothetical protein